MLCGQRARGDSMARDAHGGRAERCAGRARIRSLAPARLAAAAPYCRGRGPRPARIVRHLARRVEIDVDAPCAGWLVLTDADYPGWRARVDGVATPIRRANALFRAVHVGPGGHRVEFDYDPVSARFGLFTGLAFLGYCLVPWLTRR